MDAVRRVRKVYVRHPNYGDLAQGLDKLGLEGLEERVQVSVGMSAIHFRSGELDIDGQEYRYHRCWDPSPGPLERYSLDWAIYLLRRKPSWTGNEFRYMPERPALRAKMTEGVDGYNRTTRKSGSGSLVGQLPSIFLESELRNSHLEDMTEKYPDVCHLVLALLTRPIASHAPFPTSASPPTQSLVDMLNTESISSFTMDAEIVAVDKDTGAYRTFQDLSNRAKKDVKVEDIKVIVGVYAFDLMLLNDTVSPALV
jgi:DNA ligase-1